MQRSASPHAHTALRLRRSVNPLRRVSDLVQSVVRIAAVAVCLAGLPLAAWLGVAVHAHVGHVAAHQAATRFARPARPATGPQTPTDAPGRASYAVRSAPVTWTTADGRPVTAPLTSGGVVVDAVLAAVTLEAAVVGLAWLLLASANRLLDRHRYRRWDAEWALLSTAQHR